MVTMAAMGKKKPTTGGRQRHPALGLRLPGPLIAQFRTLAARNRRTLTAEISIALENHLGAHGLWPPGPPAAN